MKAILVKYLGPTNTKGSRIKVSACGVKSIIYPFDYGSDHQEHEAAIRFCAFNKWPIKLIGGQLPNGDYVFCFNNNQEKE